MIQKVNVQDVKIIYPIEDLLKCLPDKNSFRPLLNILHTQKLVEDLHWFLNPNILPNIKDHHVGSPCSTHTNDQNTYSMSKSVLKTQS